MRFAPFAAVLCFAVDARADCFDPDLPDSFAKDPLAGYVTSFDNELFSQPHSKVTAPVGGVWLLDAFDGETFGDQSLCDENPPVDVAHRDNAFWLVRVPSGANVGDSFHYCDAFDGEWPWFHDVNGDDPGCGCFHLTVGSAPSALGDDFTLSEGAPLVGDFAGCNSFHCSFPVVVLTLGDDVDPNNVVVQTFTDQPGVAVAGEPFVVSFYPTSATTDFLVQANGAVTVGFRLIRLSDGEITATQSLHVTGEYIPVNHPTGEGEGEGEGEGQGTAPKKSDPFVINCASTSTSGFAISVAALFALVALGAQRRRRRS